MAAPAASPRPSDPARRSLSPAAWGVGDAVGSRCRGRRPGEACGAPPAVAAGAPPSTGAERCRRRAGAAAAGADSGPIVGRTPTSAARRTPRDAPPPPPPKRRAMAARAAMKMDSDAGVSRATAGSGGGRKSRSGRLRAPPAREKPFCGSVPRAEAAKGGSRTAVLMGAASDASRSVSSEMTRPGGPPASKAWRTAEPPLLGSCGVVLLAPP